MVKQNYNPSIQFAKQITQGDHEEYIYLFNKDVLESQFELYHINIKRLLSAHT